MTTVGHCRAMRTCCGISEFGSFETYEWDETNRARLGNAGLAIAAFIDTDACRAKYESLKREFEILYQSPLHFNTGSGNHLFLVVYGAKT